MSTQNAFSLLCCDALGTTVGLRYGGYNRTRSSFGGILTITLAFVVFFTISFFGQMYLSGSERSQINSIIRFPNSQALTFQNNFIVALSTQYSGEIVEREDIWKLSAEYVSYNAISRVLNSEPLEMYPCQEAEWSDVSEEFYFFRLNKAKCLNLKNMEIKGNYNSNLFNFARISYFLNQDLTDPEKRQYLEDEIDKSIPLSTLFLKEGQAELNGKDVVMNNYINAVNVNATFKNIKDILINVSEDELHMNRDYIMWTNVEEYKFFATGSVEEKISVRPLLFKKALSFIIATSNKKNISRISFMSFSEMLARIGAIVQNVMTLFLLICYLQSYWGCERHSFNDLLFKLSEEARMLQHKNVKSFNDILSNSPDNIKKSYGHLLNRTEQENKAVDIKSNIPFKSQLGQIGKKGVTKISELALSKKNKNLKEEDDGIRRDYDELNYNTKVSVEKREVGEDSDNSRMRTNLIKSEAAVMKLNNNPVDVNKLNDVESKLQTEHEKNRDKGNSKSNTLNNRKTKPDTFAKTKISQSRSEVGKDISLVLNPLKVKIDKQIFGQLNEIVVSEGHKYPKIKKRFSFCSYIFNKYFFFMYDIRWLNWCCCCKEYRSQLELFNYIDVYLNNAIEVTTLERRYFQFEVLKYLLLNTEQLEAFEKIPRITGNRIIERINEFYQGGLRVDFADNFEDLIGQTELESKLQGLFTHKE